MAAACTSSAWSHPHGRPARRHTQHGDLLTAAHTLDSPVHPCRSGRARSRPAMERRSDVPHAQWSHAHERLGVWSASASVRNAPPASARRRTPRRPPIRPRRRTAPASRRTARSCRPDFPRRPPATARDRARRSARRRAADLRQHDARGPLGPVRGPGSAVMMSSVSSSGRRSSYGSTRAAGFSAVDARAPLARIIPRQPHRSGGRLHAKVTAEAPASTIWAPAIAGLGHQMAVHRGVRRAGQGSRPARRA
ncbi:hypothetical protein SGLAM104S_00749 [Streptomyces glaucescens]